MPTSFSSAYRVILGLFNTNWSSGSASIVTYVPEVVYQQESLNQQVNNSRYFAYASLRNTSSSQRALRNSAGNRLFTTFGEVNIYVYCPRLDNQFYDRGVRLSELARDSYRGVVGEGGIWFREFVINDLANAIKGFYVFYVNGIYQYDEET